MSEDDPNPQQRLAVLLGASSFERAPKLAQGRAFYNSARDFFDYLTSPDGLGLSHENVNWRFDDTRSPGDQLRDVGDFLEKRLADLKGRGIEPKDLIVYYVGHGLFWGPDHAYCLAVRATEEQDEGLSSIRVADLASIIKSKARWLRRFLIFDCCFSGAALREFQSGPLQTAKVKVLDELPHKGTALLCSASAQDPSLAPVGLQRTMFSDTLLKVLYQPHPTLGPQMSLSELGDLISTNLKQAYRDTWVRPEIHSPDQREGDIAGVSLFPNAAFHAASRKVPESDVPKSLVEEPVVPHSPRVEEPAEPAPQLPTAQEWTQSLCMGCMGNKGSALRCPECGWDEGQLAESPQHLPPRSVLDGKYLVGRALGQGGFGITYLGWDLNLNCKLALKEYFPRDLCTRGRDECTVQPLTQRTKESFAYGLDKFVEEGQTLARFRDQPGIVSVLGYFKENGTAYLVMGYVKGVTFKQYLQEHNGRISFPEALRILTPVMNALCELHSVDLVHRDISPDNIYLSENGQVKLLDFGAARYALGEASQDFSVVLKHGYAPEEQFRRQGRQGAWTDVYALGATLYRAITGKEPSDAPDRLVHDDLVPPRQLGIDISPGAEGALLKSLAVRAGGRFRSIAEFKSAISAGPLGPLRRFRRQVPWVAAAAIAGLVAAWFWAHHPAQNSMTGAGSGGRSEAVTTAGANSATRLQGAQASGQGLTGSQSSGSAPAIPVANPPAGLQQSSSPLASGDVQKSGFPAITGKSQTFASHKHPQSSQTKSSASVSHTAQAQGTGPPVAIKSPAALQPKSFQDLVIEGDMAFQDNQYGKALAAYKQAYQRNSSDHALRRKIRTTLLLLGQPEDAQQYQ